MVPVFSLVVCFVEITFGGSEATVPFLSVFFLMFSWVFVHFIRILLSSAIWCLVSESRLFWLNLCQLLNFAMSCSRQESSFLPIFEQIFFETKKIFLNRFGGGCRIIWF